MNDSKYYWNPGAGLRMEEPGRVYIEGMEVPDGKNLFPEFYNIASRGTTPEEISEAFPSHRKQAVSLFRSLQRMRVLIPGIPELKELMHSMEELTEAQEDERLFTDEQYYESYRIRQSLRDVAGGQAFGQNAGQHGIGMHGAQILQESTPFATPSDSFVAGKETAGTPSAYFGEVTGERPEVSRLEGRIPLGTADMPEWLTRRETVRQFDEERIIPYPTLSALLGTLRDRPARNHTRFYPSAGGLYPIDIYLYVKDQRVESVPGGTYYYLPSSNELIPVDTKGEITEKLHFVTNRDIFRSAAVSLFLVFNGTVSIPKYGSMAYAYGLIDTGILTGMLCACCAEIGLGACSIGDLDMNALGKILRLDGSQAVFHDIEIGAELLM